MGESSNGNSFFRRHGGFFFGVKVTQLSLYPTKKDHPRVVLMTKVRSVESTNPVLFSPYETSFPISANTSYCTPRRATATTGRLPMERTYYFYPTTYVLILETVLPQKIHDASFQGKHAVPTEIWRQRYYKAKFSRYYFVGPLEGPLPMAPDTSWAVPPLLLFVPGEFHLITIREFKSLPKISTEKTVASSRDQY